MTSAATRPSLAAESGAQRRAVAYIRESTEEQAEGYSPAAQRQAITRYADDHDLDLVGEYVDYQSGWRGADKRPQFQRLMADATDGCFDVVLVYHTSRFARNQLEARRYKQLLRDRLGVAVVSVTQPLGQDPADPTSFLSESIHEVFDEYYSVSLSFWTRAGLREKARQGHLTGTLPWGYQRDAATRQVTTDPENARLVRELFERYAQGGESDRTLAAWLNLQGARTTKNRPFSKDTVRELLLNNAYAGYVSHRRQKTGAIRGHHPPIITDELYDQVQRLRAAKTTTLHPGRPSAIGYALSKLLRCERCGAPMHGSRGSTTKHRRYYCATRRNHAGCDQPLALADDLETEILTYLAALTPPAAVQAEILRRLEHHHPSEAADATQQAARLRGQLERLKDLYQLGDLTRTEYLHRRHTITAALDALTTPESSAIDLQAAANFLNDLSTNLAANPNPAEHNQLLRIIFHRIWQDNGHIIAVQPHPAFLNYLQTAHPRGCKKRERRDSNPRPPAREATQAGTRFSGVSEAPPHPHPIAVPARLSTDRYVQLQWSGSHSTSTRPARIGSRKMAAAANASSMSDSTPTSTASLR